MRPDGGSPIGAIGYNGNAAHGFAPVSSAAAPFGRRAPEQVATAVRAVEEMVMLFLVWTLVVLVCLAAAHVVRVVAWWNWRWHEGSWRARGALSVDGRGVIVQGLPSGNPRIPATYLRDRGWTHKPSEAVVFRDERSARRVVRGLRLTIAPSAFVRVGDAAS